MGEVIPIMADVSAIVPMLRVGTQSGTLRVPEADAKPPSTHPHAERANDLH